MEDNLEFVKRYYKNLYIEDCMQRWEAREQNMVFESKMDEISNNVFRYNTCEMLYEIPTYKSFRTSGFTEVIIPANYEENSEPSSIYAEVIEVGVIAGSDASYEDGKVSELRD